MSGTQVSTRLARFVSEGSTADPEWRLAARILLADALVLARATDRVPRFSAVHELGSGSGDHLSWASGRQLGAADSVHANAAAVHARFQDDTDMSTWSHPASFVVPAAVASAQLAGATFGTLVDALVVGYSATRWLGGRGAVAEKLKRRGFRPSPVFAPLGAATASARALGLDVEASAHAIDAAALLSRGSLLSVASGADDWRIHNAGGARDGFTVVLAAQRGMRGPADALTAPRGFLDVITGDTTVPPAWNEDPSGALVTEVWSKAYPVLGDNMAVVLAAAELARRLREGGSVLAEGLQHDGGHPRIGRVVVRMNAKFAAFPGTQRSSPFETETAAQASVRFATAQLLLTGRLDYEDLLPRDRPEVDALADAIEVIPDESLDYTDAVVEVETPAGSLTVRARDLPRTLFYRDIATQTEHAGALLGDAGRHLVRTIVEAGDEDDAVAVVAASLELFFAAGGASAVPGAAPDSITRERTLR